MFGLTGDLGEKKLFPALYELAAAASLGIPVVGVGRTEHSEAEVRSMMEESLEGFEPAGGGAVDPEVTASIELSYLAGDSTDAATYDALAERLGAVTCPVVYAALPPGIFGDVARGIAQSALPESTRLVTEKPFGSSARSARDLFDDITRSLDPANLFIVDHFLAKSAIENMLTIRTSNALVDNSMCSRFVESIDIEMAESGGVDGRGSFYESVGAIRDVLQNHLLQLLAMLTMEQPAGGSDEAVRAGRTELLEAVVPFTPEATVVGQYLGYREVGDVAADSSVETFVAARTTIDNERWRGVPVTIRTGKRLGSDSTVATVTLASPATARDGTSDGWVPNRIRFTVKPDASVIFDIGVLDPESHEPVPATVEACAPSDHGRLGDYAVMLDNAMSGDTRHFADIDSVVAAWTVVEPIVAADLAVHSYEAGSDGPAAAAHL